MDYYALRNKHTGLYISKSPASRMILSRDPNMICFFNEENEGEKVYHTFYALSLVKDAANIKREDFETVEIVLP